MNQRKMSLVVASLAVLSMPAFAQVTTLTVASQSDRSDLALYGTRTPVVAGASTSTGTVTDAPAGTPGIAGTTTGPTGSEQVASSMGGSDVTTPFSVNTPGAIMPAAGNASAAGGAAGSPPGDATTSANGPSAATASTMDCASMTAVVGVSPGQMPSDCAP